MSCFLPDGIYEKTAAKRYEYTPDDIDELARLAAAARSIADVGAEHFEDAGGISRSAAAFFDTIAILLDPIQEFLNERCPKAASEEAA